MSFRVLKADGTYEFFKVEKLRRSLRRAGAKPAEVFSIIKAVEAKLYDGIKTQEIFALAFELLRQSKTSAATRYSLRRALFSLGPTGFPFERFLAKLFQANGYRTKTGVIIPGQCAPHEIDVAAYKTDHSFVAEAKFHARAGIKSDLQVVMYSYARLMDLKSARICAEDICGIKEFWVITNTKFTHTAEKYANCVGLNLLSWDYPRKNNLHDRMQRSGVYPITVLNSLTNNQFLTLISNDCITCDDLLKQPHLLKYLHLTPEKIKSVLAEAEDIVTNQPINQ